MKKLRLLAFILALVCAGMAQAGKVNVNTAEAEVIAENLVGVGPAKAQAIVEYRNEHGHFESADELVKVRGIGAATVNKNLDNIVISMNEGE